MKYFFIILSFVPLFIQAQETIQIAKANSNDPLEVCNEQQYSYNSTISGLLDNFTYEVSWIPELGNVTSSGMSSATINGLHQSIVIQVI